MSFVPCGQGTCSLSQLVESGIANLGPFYFSLTSGSVECAIFLNPGLIPMKELGLMGLKSTTPLRSKARSSLSAPSLRVKLFLYSRQQAFRLVQFTSLLKTERFEIEKSQCRNRLRLWSWPTRYSEQHPPSSSFLAVSLNLARSLSYRQLLRLLARKPQSLCCSERKRQIFNLARSLSYRSFLPGKTKQLAGRMNRNKKEI
jgi:hypothetical protein